MSKRMICDLSFSKPENVILKTEFVFEDKLNRRFSKTNLKTILDACSIDDLKKYIQEREEKEIMDSVIVKIKP